MNKFLWVINCKSFLLFLGGILLFFIYQNYFFNKITLFVVSLFLYLLVLVTSFMGLLIWTLNTTWNNIWSFLADFSLLLLMVQSIILVLIICIVVLVIDKKHFNN